MIFGHNYFISEPIFKLFVALFRTHELPKDGMVIFFFWCFRKVRLRKMQFLKDGVQTVEGFSYNVHYTLKHLDEGRHGMTCSCHLFCCF